MANYQVSQHLYGDQGQVSGPQVPLLGHGDEIENPNLASIVMKQKMMVIQPMKGGQGLGQRGLGYVAP